ncbi:MAG: hypothetical protein NTV23_00810 [Propionibacteriales bacterium]|nr:hypothetical protein [Propionibacteriales bacterium]
MTEHSDETDDALRRRLRTGDPATALPPLDPNRVAALLEETMSETPNHSPKPGRSRWLLVGGVAAAAAVLGVVALGLGDNDESPSGGGSSTEPLALPTPSTTELEAGPAVAAKCLAPTAEAAARQTVAFEGIVTEIKDGTVTLAPTHFYAGEETALVKVAAPDQGMSEAPDAFVVGGEYIVGAKDGRVAICGLTGPADADLRGLYEAAFGK